MAELQRFPLTTSTGQTGYVLRRARFIDPAEQSRVVLDDGTELLAPSAALEPKSDGSFHLHVAEVDTQTVSEQNGHAAPPPTARTPAPSHRPEPQRPETVRSDARTEPPSRDVISQASSSSSMPALEHTESLYADEVGIDRVAVNQIVDEPPSNRQDGDLLIIPVVEEILVVQKRYLVKEEIRINRRRQPVAEPRRILLDKNEPVRS